jgi:hypothetical protein
MHVKYSVSILFIISTVVFGQDPTQKLEFIVPKHEIVAVEKLVDQAIQHVMTHQLYESCISFKNDAQWQYPNAQLMLFDDKDIIWLCTYDDTLSWNRQELEGLKTPENIPLLKVIHEKGVNGEWVPFLIWQNDITNAYFKTFKKGDASYTIGILIFPQNTMHEVAKMVLKTLNYLRDNGSYQTINAVNRLVGPFIQGNLSVSLYNQNGIGIADSYDMTRIGLGSDFWFDDNKNNVFKTFENAADNDRSFGWALNPFHGHERKTFILKEKGHTTTNPLFITSGFYTITDDYIINLTRRAKKILLKQGVSLFEQPSKIGSEATTLRLNVAIYDDKGVLQLHTRYPALRGINLIEHQDHAGNFVTKELVKTALTQGHGWVFSYIFNAVQPIYVEKAVLPEGTFVVTVQGYTPIDKKNIIANRAEIVCRFLLDHSLKETMGILSLQKTEAALNVESWAHAGYFYRLYDGEHYCLSAGPHYNKVWDKADPEIINFLNTLKKHKKEGDWLSYKRGNKEYYAYVKKCTKSPTENYSIVVGYVSITTKGKVQ